MPPVAKKQLPNGPLPRKTAPPPPADDVWGSIDTIRMLLYGQSGTGKTTLWATFPGPILALLCSGGNKPGELRSINTAEYRKKITPRVVTTIADFKRHTEDADQFQTVVLDHASGLADLALKEILGLQEIPVQKSWGMAKQQDYGQQALQAKEMFRFLLNLPGHVVIVAQERTFGGDSDNTSDVIKPTVGAALSPSVTGWLNPACDYVVNTFKRPVTEVFKRTIAGKEVTEERRGKGVQYCLRTGPDDTYMTKFRIPKERNLELPEYLVDPTYDKIRELIEG